MKRLPVPVVDPVDVYAKCIIGVTTTDIAARLTDATQYVEGYALQYVELAAASELHLFPPSAWGNDSQLVLGNVTKGELNNLYTNQLVKRNQPGRPYYDRLMLSAPLGKCPYCGFGHVSTLDHYLPKARYPLFSVLPANLVPACTDCNKGKGSGVLDGQNQVPHPYFEDSRIETDIWLYATVNETSPATATFWIAAPSDWPTDLAQRAANYFGHLRLASRFAIEASSELASLSNYLGQLEANLQIGTHLKLVAQTERKIQRNSWRAALYEALTKSAWYREEGYRRPT